MTVSIWNMVHFACLTEMFYVTISRTGYRRNFEEANGGPLDGRRLRRTLLGSRVAL